MRSSLCFCLAVLVLSSGIAAQVSEADFNKEVDIYTNAGNKFCWKQTYGRGVGVIPLDCGSKQYDAGLCYDYCNQGYKGVGPVCWQTCPEGYEDHPASCYQNIISWFFKNSYGRGVGTVPTSCQDNKQYDAGLCYPFCQNTFYGVGPVCWKQCAGYTSVDCGAACANSGLACAEGVFNMVKSVFQMVYNIFELVVTCGGSAAIKASKEATLQAAFKTAKDFIKKNLTKEAFKNFMKKKAMAIGQTINAETLDMLFNRATVESVIKLEVEVMSKMDPTGIADVILAFWHDIC